MRLAIDYDRHPAFQPFVSRRAAGVALSDAFVMLDQAIAEHIAGSDPSGRGVDAARRLFVRTIEDDGHIEEGFKPYVVGAWDAAIARSTKEEQWRRHRGNRRSGSNAKARKTAGEIFEEGFAVFRMPRETLDQLRGVLASDIDILRRRMVEVPDDIITTSPSNPEAVGILTNFCRRSGLFEALSEYFGEKYGRAGFVIHLSHPRDTWYKVFDDISLAMPKTTQMHFDLELAVPKSMLYLNDVHEDQGPFSLIPKAQPWDWFGSELAFCKELLYGVQYYMEKQGKTLRGNTSPFRFTEARRAFVSLPQTLRGTSHPGDHIVDDSKLSQDLLSAEIKMVGEAGMMPVFVGSHVLHRGGLVKAGERLALQIIFPPGDVARRGWLPPVGWGIRGKIMRGVRKVLGHPPNEAV